MPRCDQCRALYTDDNEGMQLYAAHLQTAHRQTTHGFEDLPVTRIPPPEEIFSHDYVAACNFALLAESMPAAELILRVNGKDYPILTLQVQSGALLIDKVHVHGWRKRTAS
jgi:hypothetical protein